MITAAKTNSTEAIKLLLKNNYDPNFADEEGNTALVFGILSENTEATEILLPKTTEHLDVALKSLAEAKSSSFVVSQSIKDEVKKIIGDDKQLLWIFLERVSFFGNDQWFDWFLKNFPEEMKYFCQLETILRNVIMSDNPKACELIQTNFEKHLKNKELQELALSRGKRGVLKALKLKPKVPLVKKDNRKSPQYEMGVFGELKLKPEAPLTEDIYKKFPKFEEFSYDNKIGKVKSTIKSLKKRGKENVWIKLKDLKTCLKAPTVHYGEKYKYGCPSNCTHMRICLRVRQIEKMVLDAADGVAEEYPIFKGSNLIVVGSMKEDTKVGAIDEADMTLIGNPRLEKYLEFDDDNQAIVLYPSWRHKPDYTYDLPDYLEDFIEDDKLDITKYFNTFLGGMHKIMGSGKIKLPEGLKF